MARAHTDAWEVARRKESMAALVCSNRRGGHARGVIARELVGGD